MTTTTTDPPLRSLIEAELERQAGPVADASLRLWRALAPELISIIGELGFETLYARSVRQARQRHPWIRQDSDALRANDLFVQLRDSLQAQDAAHASQASLLLFTTFFDTLASLIGDALTKHLLRSAWRREASEIPGKNFNDE